MNNKTLYISKNITPLPLENTLIKTLNNTLKILFLFTAIILLIPVYSNIKNNSFLITANAEEKETNSEIYKDNNTNNIEETTAISNQDTQTILTEIQDTLHIQLILFIVFIGAFLGYVAISRLM